VPYEVERTDEEWKSELSSDRYAVLRKAATEAPFSGSLLHVDAEGVFRCGGCGQRLFTSAQKFDSG
jgi:peptide-methionine (R)-S-oxide reductase